MSQTVSGLLAFILGALSGLTCVLGVAWTVRKAFQAKLWQASWLVKAGPIVFFFLQWILALGLIFCGVLLSAVAASLGLVVGLALGVAVIFRKGLAEDEEA